MADDFYEAIAPYYDAMTPFEHYVPRYEWLLSEFGESPSVADSLLDLGCGTGALLAALGEGRRRVVGVDLCQAMLDVATERTSAELVCADARQFDFGDTFKLVVASFDVVNNFLESTETLQPFVETVGRVLAPGGTFVCDIATETGMAEAHAGGRATIVRQDSIATLELLPQARDGQHDFLLRLLARVDRTTFTESSFTSSEWTRPTADVVASFQTLGETFVLGDRPGEPVDAQHRAWIVVGALAPRIRSATKAPRPRWGMPRRRRRR